MILVVVIIQIIFNKFIRCLKTLNSSEQVVEVYLELKIYNNQIIKINKKTIKIKYQLVFNFKTLKGEVRVKRIRD